MKKIIEIKAESKNILRVGYLLTTACSYSCRYCPDRLHNGTNKTIDIDALKNFFLELRKQKEILLDITGGEATLHPQFLSLVKMCREVDVKTSVGTNASRSLRWFQDNSDYVDNWVITIHPSQHELDLEKIKAISKNTFTVVHVMMDPEYWEKSIEYHQKLSSVKNIKLVMLKLIDNWAGANFTASYTEEQLNYITENNWLHTFEDDRINQLQVLLDFLNKVNNSAIWSDGTITELDPYLLIKLGQNKFKDWNCYAGEEVITIDENENVYWANCRVKNLGNYKELKLEKLQTSVVCPLDSCDCTTDIRAKKSKL